MTISSIWPDEEKREIALAIISALALICGFFGWNLGLPFNICWITIAISGWPIVMEAIAGLFTRFDIKGNVLVSLGIMAAICIGETFAAAEVAFIMSLGEMLEEHTAARARAGIEKLVDMNPQQARVINAGVETLEAVDAVRPGDILKILPGESIPLDGVVVSGRTSVDQSLLTGESLPVDKNPDDEVYSGTINQFGAIEMRATKLGSESALQRMILLVQAANSSRAPIVRIMDKWATWITLAAILTAIGTWLFTDQIIRGVTVLVVFCPCALVLSTPTAIMAAIGAASKMGALISSGETMERLGAITGVVFDKTGTLTFGKPQVDNIHAVDHGINANQVLKIAAGLENYSEHPLGRAVAAYAKKNYIDVAKTGEIKIDPGRGISGVVAGKKYYCGNLAYIRSQNINAPDQFWANDQAKEGKTVIYLASQNGLVGMIALADTIRPNARKTIGDLGKAHLSIAMLSGDNEYSVSHIAIKAGIKDVHAHLLPEDKVNLIKQMQAKSEKICMIGDGINDAPALKTAYVGIAMGKVGSGVAMDAADCVLMHDNIAVLPRLVDLARKTARTIRANIVISLAINFCAVILAITGFMGPVVGAFVHNAGSILVVLNSARLLKDNKEVKNTHQNSVTPSTERT